MGGALYAAPTLLVGVWVFSLFHSVWSYRCDTAQGISYTARGMPISDALAIRYTAQRQSATPPNIINTVVLHGRDNHAANCSDGNLANTRTADAEKGR
jgi:hypothetical protein